MNGLLVEYESNVSSLYGVTSSAGSLTSFPTFSFLYPEDTPQTPPGGRHPYTPSLQSSLSDSCLVQPESVDSSSLYRSHLASSANTWSFHDSKEEGQKHPKANTQYTTAVNLSMPSIVTAISPKRDQRYPQLIRTTGSSRTSRSGPGGYSTPGRTPSGSPSKKKAFHGQGGPLLPMAAGDKAPLLRPRLRIHPFEKTLPYPDGTWCPSPLENVPGSPGSSPLHPHPSQPPASCVGGFVSDEQECPPCQAQYDDPDGYLRVQPGDVIHQRYLVGKVLGQGTYGTVLACHDRQYNGLGDEWVAIKIIRAIPKYRYAGRMEIHILRQLHRKDPAIRSSYLASPPTTPTSISSSGGGLPSSGPASPETPNTTTTRPEDQQNICIELKYWFEYRHHLCMVFPLFQRDLFSWLQSNAFHPFPLYQLQHIARQLFRAVAYLHSLTIIHTDLKPENILLTCEDSVLVPGSSKTDLVAMPLSPESASLQQGGPHKRLLCTEIALIEFGSAILEENYRGDIVSTRHYRAPEIILELGWSYACDIWSIGCILMELATGKQLYNTHDNLEHLALMERTCGIFPSWMVRALSLIHI